MNSGDKRFKPSHNGVGSNPTRSTLSSASRKVEVKLTEKGWFFIYGGREAGPYKHLSQPDEVKVAAKLSGLDQRDIDEWKRVPGEDKEKWTVQPKDVFKAKLVASGLREKPQPRRREPRDYPVFPPSLMATCFKRRFMDVGDCDDFGCQYWSWCILQLRAISEGAILQFYDKDPTKCVVCHRRKAIYLFIVERGSKAPNSLFVTCNACTAKLPQHWTILKREDLLLDC